MATNYFVSGTSLILPPTETPGHLMVRHLSFSHFFLSFFFLANFQKISFTSGHSALNAFQVHSHLHLKTHFIARCSGGPRRHYRNGGRLVSSFLHHFTSETGVLQEHSGVFFMSTFRAFQPDAEGYFHSAWVIRHVSNKTWALLLCVFSLSWYNRTRSIPRHRASHQTFDYGPRVVKLIEEKTLH